MDRNYKPIGFLSEKWVDYGADTIRKLSIQAHTEGDIYLYDDNCVPTDGEARDTDAATGVLGAIHFFFFPAGTGDSGQSGKGDRYCFFFFLFWFPSITGKNCEEER